MRGDIMQEIVIYNPDDTILTELTQWDNNVSILIKEKDLDNSNRVHFFNCNSKEAIAMEAVSTDKGLSVRVPNKILEEPHTITGYVWLGKELNAKNGNSSETAENKEHKSVCCFRIPVRKRPKPSNYVYKGENEYLTFEKVLIEVKEYAAKAGAHKKDASTSAALSQSYAVGGTNTRENENTDNAKYYAVNAGISEENAAASSTSAATQAMAAERSADRAIEKAAHAAASATEAESFAHGGTETRVNEAIDNARYYCEQSHNNSKISKEYLGKVEEAGNEAVNAIKNALAMDKPYFQVDLSTGHLMYEGGRFMFQINDFGHLEWGITI